MVLLIFILIGMALAYIKLEQENIKLKKEIELLLNKASQLEQEARDQANKNIILESILKKRNNNQDGERRIY
jgi:predicted Holliday junction resolvase-like endonuclease